LGNAIYRIKAPALALCLLLGLTGCAIKGARGSKASERGERLAIERGRLSETTDAAARTRSYIVISDLLLSFAADAAKDEAMDELRALLTEYGRTIQNARETIAHVERPAGREPQVYNDLDAALRRHVKTLQDIRSRVNSSDHPPLDQAIQLAASIRDELSQIRTRTD